MPTRLPFIFGLLVAGCYLTPLRLQGVDGQVKAALYSDTNAFEAAGPATWTFGVTMGARLMQQLVYKRMTSNVVLAGQAVWDPAYESESKYILNPSLRMSYLLAQDLSATADLVLFKKEYDKPIGAYLRTLVNLSVVYYPEDRFAIWLAHRRTEKVLRIESRFRYSVEYTGVRFRVRLTDRYITEAGFGQKSILHRDVLLPVDSSVLSGRQRSDNGFQYNLHIRYTSGIITGFKYGFESIRSNSLAGDYNLTTLNIYMSVTLWEKSFAHVSLRRIDKRYRYTQFDGVDYFLDPEEPLQNLADLRLERDIGNGIFHYFQVSLLENETTLNRVYYNKVLAEFGIKRYF